MQAIRRTGSLQGSGEGRQLFDVVVKIDQTEGVAWVHDDDVRPEDEQITEAEYDAYANDIRAWNEANTPAPPPDPMETEFQRLQQLLGPDWAGSEAAWAALTAAQRAEHLRIRTNALRDSVIFIVQYVQGRLL